VSERDPIRLTDPASGAPDELRALFEAGARDLPTQARLTSLSAKLGPLLGPPVAATAGGAASSGSALGAGKLAAVAAALIGGAVLVATVTREVPENVPAPRPLPVETVQKPVEAPVPAPVASEPAPAAEPPSAPPSAAERSAPRAERRSNAELEADLLERARAALRSNPAHAYALTSEHKLRFPGGVLAQEREVIAIDALRRLGKNDQAALRADSFAKSYPSSAHRHKLDAGAK
jgi:type IV secretory pathway VirB10-like protein